MPQEHEFPACELTLVETRCILELQLVYHQVVSGCSQPPIHLHLANNSIQTTRNCCHPLLEMLRHTSNSKQQLVKIVAAQGCYESSEKLWWLCKGDLPKAAALRTLLLQSIVLVSHWLWAVGALPTVCSHWDISGEQICELCHSFWVPQPSEHTMVLTHQLLIWCPRTPFVQALLVLSVGEIVAHGEMCRLCAECIWFDFHGKLFTEISQAFEYIY